VIRRLPGGQLQNSYLLPAAEAADIGRQSGILADGASFVVLNIPWTDGGCETFGVQKKTRQLAGQCTRSAHS
jgi:hypothetical protein